MTSLARGLFLPALALLVALPAAGCSGDPDPRDDGSEQDILAAVQIYLREKRGINPDAMRMELIHLDIAGDHARAVIRFRSPEAPEGLEFEYHLNASAGGWEVESSSGEDHGSPPPALPPDHPPLPDPAEERQTAS